MTQTKDAIWVGTGGNVQLWGRPVNSGPVPPGATEWLAAEYELSQYPLVPDLLRPIFGDWRPPTIHRYDLETGVDVDMTPDDPLLERTLGLRAAGSNRRIVLLAGPSLTFTSMNVFAFDARTSEYLGSKQILRYSDVRRFVNVRNPENRTYGVLPAYGFFIRHVKDITMKDVRVAIKQKDGRPAFVLDDVHDSVFDEIRTESASQTPSFSMKPNCTDVTADQEPDIPNATSE